MDWLLWAVRHIDSPTLYVDESPRTLQVFIRWRLTTVLPRVICDRD